MKPCFPSSIPARHGLATNESRQELTGILHPSAAERRVNACKHVSQVTEIVGDGLKWKIKKWNQTHFVIRGTGQTQSE